MLQKKVSDLSQQCLEHVGAHNIYRRTDLGVYPNARVGCQHVMTPCLLPMEID